MIIRPNQFCGADGFPAEIPVTDDSSTSRCFWEEPDDWSKVIRDVPHLLSNPTLHGGNWVRGPPGQHMWQTFHYPLHATAPRGSVQRHPPLDTVGASQCSSVRRYGWRHGHAALNLPHKDGTVPLMEACLFGFDALVRHKQNLMEWVFYLKCFCLWWLGSLH